MRYRWFFVWAMLVGSARADVVHLKDGSFLRGEVRRDDGAWVVTDASGKQTRVEAQEIASMVLGGSTTAPTTQPDPQLEKLASLRRSVESLDDIDQILQRYQRFIDTKPGDQIVRLAQSDVALWNQRKSEGLVKFDGEWVSDGERAARQVRSLALADDARTMIRQGRQAEADPLLQQALDIDPESPPALYLRGVTMYGDNQVATSRKCFELTRDAVPQHGPTLANLGLILWRQDAILPAVNYYDQAMAAAPLEQAILDNVAEVLEAIPKKFRDDLAVKRLSERFITQDQQLQQALKAKGLYRWGSTWVDDAQMEMLKRAEAEIREKLNEIEEEFDRVQVRIDRIDEDIEANKREMRRLEASRFFRDNDGRMVRKSLPSVYYDIKEDTENLLAERKDQEARLDEFREAARAVQARLPVPRFTGVLKILGVEYAPMPEMRATTRPAEESREPKIRTPKSE
jgi:tetratricopeptide (TPR) repeat protein